ncbi:ankyrin repeat ph and sec7 domain containing protein secg-related [Anaeramoeba ignava]|uniref:Ankyrin repeat ph and sec7 domain containing protein secg-related n=1 Tax=Anaeramoeba ignava TaxID=1746090 RepID=A0A9Q0RHC3_ANAIG|nr:ankyrin repeat ph and sec7 domain containing protein secg-related [Anaeramoeba ignava]
MRKNTKKELFEACQKNSLQNIKNLLKKKSKEINEKTKLTNNTALHFACQNSNQDQNKLETIKFLVSKKANVNAENKNKETPLHLICENPIQNEYSLEIIKFLVEKKAKINLQLTGYKYTADDRFPVFEISYYDYDDCFYLEKNFENDNQEYNEQAPLHLICENQNQNEYSFEIVKFLVSKKADINSLTKKKETPLHLISDINSKTENQQTPLHLICQNQNQNEYSLEIVKFLVEKGADINSQNLNQTTPLHLICQNQNQYSFEIVKFLVEKGADINIQNLNQTTPLHLICQNQSIEIIKFFIEKGSDINLKTLNQETPLHFVSDINAKTINQETPLHFACQNRNSNSFEIIKYFVSKKVDVNIENKYNNKTPLSLLIQNSKSDEKSIQFLLMNDAIFPYLNESNLQFPKRFIPFLFKIYSINQDLNNLLKSNENFTDLIIQSNDSFKFNVHKLILLIRFDNNELILSKFIEICSQKSKEEVKNALNFIYTGFIDFDSFFNQISLLSNQKIKQYQQFEKERNKFEEKEKEIEELFKEIGIDLKWIESKKGRKGIIKDLSKLYQQNKTKDFTIIISKEKEIKVHKLILIIRSELYKGMFLNVEDSSNQVHDYSNKSNETIQQLIYFLYNDEFEKEIKEEIKEEYLDLKDYYQLNQNSIIDLFLI